MLFFCVRIHYDILYQLHIQLHLHDSFITQYSEAVHTMYTYVIIGKTFSCKKPIFDCLLDTNHTRTLECNFQVYKDIRLHKYELKLNGFLWPSPLIKHYFF